MASLLKNIVKKIVPETTLKYLYEYYLSFKRKRIESIIFPEYNIPDSAFFVKHDKYPFRLISVEKNHLDPRLKRQFDENDTWSQDEYLLVFEKACIIEPEQGWALTNKNELIYHSLGFGRAPYVPKPSLLKLFKKKPTKRYKEIISLRDTGEKNYFHFYNDIIPKLFFLKEKLNISDDIPVLISRTLFEASYFQYFYKLSGLSKLNWIIQDNYYIEAEKVYFCKPLTHTKKYFDWFLNIAPDFSKEYDGTDKIFITRNKNTTRYIENKEEVEELCKAYGFEILDFDGMLLEEQMRTFARARYAIGIHGAGLTNMIYRRGKSLSLLEIYPPGDYFPFHYILLANQYNYYYDGIIGEKGSVKFSPSFIVNIEVMENKLKSFLVS